MPYFVINEINQEEFTFDLNFAQGWFGTLFMLVVLNVYRVSHILEDLGLVDLDLRSSPGWWAAGPLL